MGALPGVELCFPSLRVAKFIGSSKARWFEERFFPLTPALPEERENRTLGFRQSRAPRLVAARDALFPLPPGEGKGEAEPDVANQNGSTGNYDASSRVSSLAAASHSAVIRLRLSIIPESPRLISMARPGRW